MEDVIVRLQKEFKTFFDNMKECDTEMIMSDAYELVIKSEIVDTFEYDIYLNEERIQCLLNFDGNLLDYLYNGWIDFDVGNIRDILHPSIQESIEELERYMKKGD